MGSGLFYGLCFESRVGVLSSSHFFTPKSHEGDLGHPVAVECFEGMYAISELFFDDNK